MDQKKNEETLKDNATLPLTAIAKLTYQKMDGSKEQGWRKKQQLKTISQIGLGMWSRGIKKKLKTLSDKKAIANMSHQFVNQVDCDLLQKLGTCSPYPT